MDVVLSPLVDACIGKVADLAAEKVGMIMGVKDELLRLRRRLLKLRNFLEDAEKKGIRDTSIRDWLGELKDVVYDAEDILDLCRVHPTNLLEEDLDQQPSVTTAVRSSSSSSSSPCFPLISCFTGAKFRHEIAKEIKKLNDRLLEIEHDSSVLSKLSTSSIIRPVDQATVGHRRQTTPLLAESEVIGQQMRTATQLLVEWLTNEDKRKYSVFGVVGMGGIGKTTLARKIYNHASIDKHFPRKIWVCVSQTYSETELLKEIIRGAGESYGEASSKAELTRILASALSRNFFLVLDDIWSADVWENLLKKTLECATASGRVLITTRNEYIVKRMLAKKVYNVQKMNNNDGWVLLRKEVFGDTAEEEETLGLKDIGIQIVNKCDGLPLAIKVIGGVLRTKDNTRSEWGKILGSNAWSMVVEGELRGALYLSYEDLPAHLKQCFLYCSLYPEDDLIPRNDLIRYWVAEGFIRSADGGDAGILMEDIADDYYLELVRRSLLQAFSDYGCYMHDMLRSLAQFLLGGESVCLVGSDATTTLNANRTALQKLRRLSLVITEEAVMPATFDTMRREHLRTLLCFPYKGLVRYNDQQLVENSSFFDVLGRHLRVLNLGKMNIENLPDSLGNLVHLRHLRLDRTRISRIPDSVQNLVNLQNLSLFGCDNLNTLPKGITQLYNLRYLNIRGTQLMCMPKGLDRMKQLNHLIGYSVGDETVEGQLEGCNMDELRNLSQMRWLDIENLDRATTGTPAITNKPFLKQMHLTYNSEPPTTGYGEADIQRMEKVLEELSPPPSIQVLGIYYYPGRGYPSWISTPSLITSSFPLLETIFFFHCMSWTQLPPLGQLPQLKFLVIAGANAIVNVGPEFAWGGHGSVQSAFPRLEKLDFGIMSNWEEWTLSAAGGDDDDDEIRSGGGLETTKLLLPRLKELHLWACPKLRSLPAGLSHANSLESINLDGLFKMIEVNQLQWLTHLKVRDCPSLERISHLPRLRKLEITDCPELKDVVHLDALCSLYLVIDEDEQYLPAWLVELAATHRQRSEEAHSSTALTVPEIFLLHLECGSALLRRCLEEGGEYWPIIQQFPEVAINTKRSRESLAYTRTPRTYIANLAD